MKIEVRDIILLIRDNLVKLFTFSIIVSCIATTSICVFRNDSYNASCSLYVLMQEEHTEGTITLSDMNASQMLTNDIANLVFTSTVQSSVARSNNLENLNDLTVTVNSQPTSRVVTIMVRSLSPELSAAVANSFAHEIAKVASDVMDIDFINVIDAATPPTSPSNSGFFSIFIISWTVCVILYICFLIMKKFLNQKIDNYSFVKDSLAIDCLGIVPTCDSF